MTSSESGYLTNIYSKFSFCFCCRRSSSSESELHVFKYTNHFICGLIFVLVLSSIFFFVCTIYLTSCSSCIKPTQQQPQKKNIYLIKAWYTDPELNAMNLNNSQHLIDLQSQHGGTSTPNNTTVTAGGSAGVGGGGNTGTMGSGKFNSEHGSECSSVTSDSIPGG